MMDYPYSTSFLMPLPGNPVQAACKAIETNLVPLDNHNKTVIQGISGGVNVYNNYTGNAKCLNWAEADDIGADMWDYQVIFSVSKIIIVLPYRFE